MSKKKCAHSKFKYPTRPSWKELGMSKESVRELQNGCKAGIYSSETLREACGEFKFLEPWILLSVTKGRSYDFMITKWELRELERAPVGKTDFYGFRRMFFKNLDCLLKADLLYSINRREN